MSDACSHERTPRPRKPVPDWRALCPDCGERVQHDGRGGFITAREVQARIATRRQLTFYPEDLAVLCESLWHSLQRADVSVEDHDRMRVLRERLIPDPIKEQA